MEKNLPMTTRDGVTLMADVMRPDLPGTFPVILSRTPYGKDGFDFNRHCHHYAQHGYVTVMQDCRGRFESDGEYEPIFQEVADGFDAVEWAARLPWADGTVATQGQSYLALTQYAILCNDPLPPSLRAAAVLSGPANPWEGWTFHRGGPSMFCWNVPYAVHKARRTLKDRGRDDVLAAMDELVVPERDRFAPPLTDAWARHLPLDDWGDILAEAAPYFAEHLSRGEDAGFWRRNDVTAHAASIDVPVLHASSWYDIFADGAPAAYRAIRDHGASERTRGAQRLVMGPWHHGSYSTPSQVVGEMDLGPAAVAVDMQAMQLAWFDRWLKGIEPDDTGDDDPVTVFTLGAGTWERLSDWPPPDAAPQAWHLRSAGLLTAEAPGDEPVETWTYDPEDPVPTLGGANLSIPMGIMDQRPVEGRDDVLVFSSHVLAETVLVGGRVRVELWASTSAVETDFTAKLVDVHPDGYAQNLLDGVIRTRYRHGRTRPEPVEPGAVEPYEIDLGDLSAAFLPGHRIRVEISSSNFPRFDRNLNTGEPFGAGTVSVVATQELWHTSDRPSRLVLPVRPGVPDPQEIA
jgi:putative CocE/NonD family hydrolase